MTGMIVSSISSLAIGFLGARKKVPLPITLLFAYLAGVVIMVSCAYFELP